MDNITNPIPQGEEQPQATQVDTQGKNTNQAQQPEATQTQAQQVDYAPFLNAIGEKARFNHEPVKPESIDDVITNYQKGLNYDSIYNKYTELQNNPAIGFVDNLAKINGMTVDQYIQAANKELERQKLNELVSKNIPQELAQEMLQNRKFREQYQTEHQQLEMQKKKETEYQEFLKAYPEFMDPAKANGIPMEVWQMANQGISLVDAYTRYENQQLKNQLTKFTQSQQTQQKNKVNAESSTGSIQGQEAVPNEYISKEEFEKNRNNQSWLYNHYDALKKSMNKWNA